MLSPGTSDDYTSLLHQAYCCDSVINKAARRRADCLRKVNAIQSSTNSLPNEVLAIIFKMACPPIDFTTQPSWFGWIAPQSCMCCHDFNYSEESNQPRSCYYFPLVLSAVSSHWRQVAQSLPDLWTTIAISAAHTNVKTGARLLQLYITNAKSLGCSLDLDLRSCYPRGLTCGGICWETGLNPIKDVIFEEFPGKIRGLRLAGSPHEWLPCIAQKLTHVANLFLDSRGAYGLSSFELQNFSSLRSIGVFSALPKDILPLPSTICVVHLTYVSFETAVTILSRCPRLIEYYFWSSGEGRGVANGGNVQLPLWIMKPFTLPSIKKFGWVSCKSQWNHSFLENIRLPNIEHLQWTTSSGHLKPERTFFSKLPESLSSLTLGVTSGFTPEKYWNHMRSKLSYLLHIERITISGGFSDFIQALFSLLSSDPPTSKPRSATPKDLLFPKLKVIQMLNYSHDRFDGANFAIPDDAYNAINSDDLASMVRRRREMLEISEFRLELPNNRLERSEEVWTVFREMVNEGFRPEVIEASERVDWSE